MKNFRDILAHRDPNALSAYYRLSSKERDVLLKILRPIAWRSYGETEIEVFISEISSSPPLPGGLAARIAEFKTVGNRFGLFLAENFPLDDISGFAKATAVSESILLAVALLIGRPYGHAGQRAGAIIQNIRPRREDAYKHLGTGSAIELIWHTEDAQAEVNCDFIGLFCLRGDPGARTFISRVDVSDLPKDIVEELEKKQFVIRSDESYSGYSVKTIVSVLSQYKNKLTVRYDPPYTKFLSQRASIALGELTNYINSKAVSVTLKSGDLLLIDNKTSVHGRSKFAPRYDDTDRWLQRIAIFSGHIPKRLLDPSNPYLIRPE
jgi:Taurine catabolism dioxygenase TauD, TfdA family